MRLKIKIILILLFWVFSQIAKGQGANHNSDTSVRIDSLLNVLYEGPFYADFEKGNEILDIAEKLSREGGLKKKEAMVYINRSWLAQNFGDLALMKSGLLKAKPIIEAIDKSTATVLVGDYYYTEASYLTRLGDFLGAIKAYRKILNLNVSDSLLLHDTYNSIGFNFQKSGNPVRALENYEKALVFNPKSQGWTEYLVSESLDLQSIGLSYLDYFSHSQDSSLLDDGVQYLQKALTQIEKSNVTYLSSINESSIFISLAKTYLIQHQLDSAMSYVQMARANHQEGDAFLYFIEKKAGEVMLARNNYKEAINFFQNAREIAKSRYEKTDFYTIDIYVQLSEVYLSAGFIDRAEGILKEGIESISDNKEGMSSSSFANLILPLETAYSKIAYEKCLVSGNLEEIDKSIDQFIKTMRLVREIRKAFPDRSFKEFLSSDGKQLAASAIDLCYKGYQNTQNNRYVELAFRFSEESKALTLLETTIENDAISYAGIPDSILQKGDELRRILAEVEIAIKTGDGSRADLEDVNRQYDIYINYLENEFPQYYELKYNVRIPDLKTISESLDDDEQVFQYFLHSGFAFLISINAREVRFEKLTSLKKQVLNQLLYCLQTNPLDQKPGNPSDTFLKYSKLVFQNLLENRINQDTKKLVVIPDGFLHLLPFEALVSEDERLLIEQYNISYDLSVSLMHYKRLKKRVAMKANYVGFAPQYNGNNTVTIRSASGQERSDRLTLGRLRYNEPEVKSLSSSLKGTHYLGDHATKENFLNEADRNGVFHLSAHGLYNDRAPLYSAVYFSQKEAGNYKNENALYAFEIYGKNLNSELGILSSCESGFGKYQSGEGLSSLRRAFDFAGCRSIVSSLWNANDKATYQIVEHFGELLAKGEEKDVALRNAKLSFLSKNQSTYGHPYFWAHLTLSGDTNSLTETSNHYLLLWIGAIFVIALMIGTGIVRKRRSS